MLGVSCFLIIINKVCQFPSGLTAKQRTADADTELTERTGREDTSSPGITVRTEKENDREDGNCHNKVGQN